MDYSKLYGTIERKQFVDLVLILNDGSNELIMNLHKIILFASCPYFEKLLTSLKEKDQTEIKIIVPDVFITHDIIMGFYGQKTNSGKTGSKASSLTCPY